MIDDFRRVELWGRGKSSKKSWMSQDKGHRQQVEEWVRGLRQGQSSIPLAEILNVHAACFAALESMQSGERAVIGVLKAES